MVEGMGDTIEGAAEDRAGPVREEHAMDANILKDLAIVSIAEGTKLGRVEDVLFDPQALRVAGLLIGGDGQTFVIPFEKIAHIGPDAVTVGSSQVTQIKSAGDAFSGLPGLDRFTRLKVVDEAGTLVGTVASIDIDGTTGRMLRFVVHKGGVLGIGRTATTVAVEAVRGIGADLITVATDAAARAPA
jgi:sporulation protein YlmC with PRC-barrel domain